MNDFKKIHETFYKREFDWPDFSRFLDVFNVDDICFGGIRPIIECVAITDKDRSVRDRKIALIKFLQSCSIATKVNGFDQIHAFVQDDSWEAILKKYDFRYAKGKALVLDV